MIRVHWRGLSGGPEVWSAIQQFFGELKTRSVEVEETRYA
jgi:hypothetical protein